MRGLSARVYIRGEVPEKREREKVEERGSSALAALSEGLADAVEKAGASVVQVHGRRRGPASGTVFASGKVLAASHAVEREEDLSVVAPDGKTFEARFVGRDGANDLAVLEVPGLEAPVVEPADGAARVGQLALSVARPGHRGEGLRASLGVVSAVGGPLRMGRGARLESYVQTDAAPYPGFSGGPMVDAGGRVIGVIALGWGRGATLAVPSEAAWRVARALAEGGSVKRGYLGILSQPVRLPEGQRGGIGAEGGLLVVGVEEESPAGRGGVLLGDILVSLDSAPVTDTDELQSLLVGERVGKEVPVGVIRGGTLQTLSVTVGERG